MSIRDFSLISKLGLIFFHLNWHFIRRGCL